MNTERTLPLTGDNSEVPQVASQHEEKEVPTSAAEIETLRKDNRISITIALIVDDKRNTSAPCELWEQENDTQKDRVAAVRNRVEQSILQNDPGATFVPSVKHLVPVFQAMMDKDVFIKMKSSGETPPEVEVWGNADNWVAELA